LLLQFPVPASVYCMGL